jgi:Zn-dependent peptidase ImmA (M78 family)/DNA-binding XRE family transcriptional regulator
VLPTNSPTPSRFALARTRRGLTKIALARRAGIGTRTLFDTETGLAIPQDETIKAIAEVTRFPEEFFFRPDVVIPTPDSASFRSLRSMTAGQRDSALAAGAIGIEIMEWVDHRFELPKPTIPDLRDYEPEAAATALRAHWKIGERAVGSMIHLLESVGIRVLSLTEDRRVDAFSLWHAAVPYVFLNTVKTTEHSRMDAAHELGHLVLHRHGGRWGRDVEKDAQAFASAFLMPRASVLAMPRLTAPTLAHLVQMKKRWLVSAAALAHRLHELRLLSDWAYRGLCIQLSKYGRTREPDGIGPETSKVMTTVFGPSGESKSDVATDLALFQPDVEALVFGLRAAPSANSARTMTGRRAGSKHLRIV